MDDEFAEQLNKLREEKISRIDRPFTRAYLLSPILFMAAGLITGLIIGWWGDLSILFKALLIIFAMTTIIAAYYEFNRFEIFKGFKDRRYFLKCLELAQTESHLLQQVGLTDEAWRNLIKIAKQIDN